VGTRLREIRQELGMTQQRFAEEIARCTQEFISQVEHGKSSPSAELVAAVELLGYSPRWLMTGEGEKRGLSRESADRVADQPSEWRRLPILGRVSAGYPGRPPVEGSVEGHLALPHTMVTDPDAFCLRVNSDSMKGEVEKGDLVVVSPALSSSIRDGDLVVVRVDSGDVVLKRYVRAGGRAILVSSNAAYPPIILDAARSPTIIGKVLYAIRHYK